MDKPDLPKLHAALGLVCDVLDARKIPYAVAGGLAVTIWGEPRATFDVDVAIAAETADAEFLSAAIRSEPAFLLDPQILPMPPQMNIVRAHLLNKVENAAEIILVDFLLLPPDLAGSLQKRRVPLSITGKTCWVCSCEDLIVLKLLAGRVKDLEDIRGMLRIQQSAIDRAYVDKWAQQLQVDDAWRGCNATP